MRRTIRFARSPIAGLERAAKGAKIWWLIFRSGLFDFGAYRAQCRERGLRVIDPIGHYLRRGALEGLNPHPLFETRYYLLRNADVEGRMNPLAHYLLFGDQEGRRPHRFFDPGFYRAANPDVVRSGWNSLSHFVNHGMGEGRPGDPRVDVQQLQAYAARHGGEGEWTRYAERLRGAALAGSRASLRLHLEVADTADAAASPPGEEPAKLRRLRSSGLFDPAFYQAHWGVELDEAGDAAEHFLERGSIEGVPFCPVEQLTLRLKELETAFEDDSRPELAYLRTICERRLPHERHRVTLHVSSLGNSFFAEMAELLAQGFRAAGAEARILDEKVETGEPLQGSWDHAIVVAPHEFFLLGEGPLRLSRRFLARSSLWLAEQPGSEFFAMGLWFARFARRVLDVNPLTALAWGELGVSARALPLGWVDGLPDYAEGLELETPHVAAALAPEARAPVRADAPWAERAIDIFFNGVLTPHRERFFVRNAGFFGRQRCALFMPTSNVPISARLASALSVRDATALSQRARILLNVHRSETPYFEWHRLVVRGLWQKTLVVSEPSLPVPGFEPGEHYIECELDEMASRLEWLLRSEEGRVEAERIRAAGFAALQRSYPMASLAAAFLAEDGGEGAP